MRHRLIIIVGAVVLGATGIYFALRLADSSPLATTASTAATTVTTVSAGPTLAAQTEVAGEVTVEVEPIRLDDGGAEFRVTLDTHAVALDMDMTTAAQLEVDGVSWPLSGWTGDGPGGHHRQGQLSFRPGGPATGSAHLTIGGLPAPVDMVWGLSG